VLLIRAGRRSPVLAVGWLWYLGTLVPVIGLVQVGNQSMADRYMYVPLIGLAIVTAWGVPAVVGDRSTLKPLIPGAAIVVLVACAIASRAQVHYWKDTVALWEHTVQVTSTNPFARNSLGAALERQGRVDEATAQYFEAARMRTAVYYHGSESVLINVANRFLAQQQFRAAFDSYSAALRLNPKSPDAHNGLGSVLGQERKFDEAIVEFMEAVRLAPDHPGFRYNLAQALENKGRTAEAVEHLQRALTLDPSNARARRKLEGLRAK
jgi:protein O-mannosyl-transferase